MMHDPVMAEFDRLHVPRGPSFDAPILRTMLQRFIASEWYRSAPDYLKARRLRAADDKLRIEFDLGLDPTGMPPRLTI